MLRNINMTAPYFHDGSVYGLSDAVKTMAEYQLGRIIDDADAAKIVAFLQTLDGELPKILELEKAE
jgi:cytochrome c peroxidase